MKVKGYRIKNYLFLMFQALDALIGKNKSNYLYASLKTENIPTYDYVINLPEYEKNEIIDYLISYTKNLQYDPTHSRIQEIKKINSTYRLKDLNRKKNLLVRIKLENIQYLEKRFKKSREAGSKSFINDCIEEIIMTYISDVNESDYNELMKVYKYLIQKNKTY